MRFLLIIRLGKKRAEVVAPNRFTAEDAAYFYRQIGFKVRIFDRWRV